MEKFLGKLEQIVLVGVVLVKRNVVVQSGH